MTETTTPRHAADTPPVDALSDADFQDYPDETAAATTTDALAQEQQRPAKPAGAPSFIPATALRRPQFRERLAQFLTLIDTPAVRWLLEQADEQVQVDASRPGLASITDARQVAVVVVDITKAFRAIVIPQAREQYEQWVLAVDNSVLVDLLVWYIAEMQPGEAPSSSS